MANKGHADPVDIEVGQRIRIRRRERRTTQLQLAVKLGISCQQVQKYENGRNRVGAGRLLAVARILGVSVDYFFASPPLPTAKGKAPEQDILAFLATADGVRMNRAFIRIKDPMVRLRVLRLVRSLTVV